MPMRVHTVRERVEVDRLLAMTEPLEPRTTLVNGALLNGRRREVRVVAVENDDGGIAGIAVAMRECLDRWEATAIVLDPRAAEPLARWLDAGPARAIVGLARDLDPLVPYLERVGSVGRMPWYAFPAPVPQLPAWLDLPAGDRSRVASRRDGRGLARAYESYELDGIPTILQLRRHVRRHLRRGLPALVVEADGKIVAASRASVLTQQYTFWTDATVLPEYRRRGYWWVLTIGARELCSELGVGFIGTASPSSQLPNDVFIRVVEEIGGATDEWVTLRMHTPVRFRGQGKLRQAFWLLAGRRRPRTRTATP